MGRESMSTLSSTAAPPASEPKPIIPPLASFYGHSRDLAWLIIRLTAGGMLLAHGIMKVMPMAEKGFTATIEAFATGSMARRGIEPAIAAAYAVFFLETVGAVLLMLGLFTRFIRHPIRGDHVRGALAGRLRCRPRRMGISAVLGPHRVRDRVARRRPLLARPQARLGAVASSAGDDLRSG